MDYLPDKVLKERKVMKVNILEYDGFIKVLDQSKLQEILILEHPFLVPL
jgi:hypothetical protein